MASFSTFSSVDRGLDSPEGRDNIEDGLCWFKHLPMANDGNTVMAVYVGPALSRPSSTTLLLPAPAPGAVHPGSARAGTSRIPGAFHLAADVII